MGSFFIHKIDIICWPIGIHFLLYWDKNTENAFSYYKYLKYEKRAFELESFGVQSR